MTTMEPVMGEELRNPANSRSRHSGDRQPCGEGPNVVVILTDDLGWGDLGCYGSEDIRTPHIDALAERGIRMTNWYANAPVCSPTRASLLTGRYPAHAGVEGILGAPRNTTGLPPQETLASALQAAGWTTALYGKWHLGVAPESSPLRHGFDEYFGFRAGCVDYYSHIMYWGNHNPLHDLWEGDEEVWLNGEYLTHAITRRAVDFVENAKAPFFCFVSYNAPHYPMHAPAEAMERYAHLPWDRQVMAAMIGCVDDGVGELVAALARAGRLEDTIIVLTSDNGPSAEERNWLGGEEIAYRGGSAGGLRGHKGSLYEGGIRVPCIWSWPGGLPQGRVCDDPAASMDVAPTVASAVGAPLADLDGVDLGPVLSGGQASTAERPLAWAYDGQAAIRVGKWKYVTNPKDRLGGEREAGGFLHDLERDPAETANASDGHPEVARELAGQLERWETRFRSWRRDHR